MPDSPIRFADFELDSARFELRRNDRVLKLERIPLELLILLAEKNGSVVSRQEIIDRLWGKDVFVDTEHGINTAIRKIRQTLRDDPDEPRFILTVTGKGYRFVSPVVRISRGNGAAAVVSNILPAAPGPAGPAIEPFAQTSAAIPHPVAARRHMSHNWRTSVSVAATLIILAAAGIGVYSVVRRPDIKPFQNFTMTQITNSGKAVLAAISPDGRFVLS